MGVSGEHAFSFEFRIETLRHIFKFMIHISAMHRMNLRRIDLNLLIVLQALLAERHITRAANRLNMSQPAVSHALNRLRLLLNDRILIRSGHEMLLTSRATEISKSLEMIVQDISELLTQRHFDPTHAIGRARIAATEGAIVTVLLEALATISVKAPGIEIEISSEMTNIYERLRLGEIDAAIDVFSDVPERGFCVQPLFSNSLLCVTRKSQARSKVKIGLPEYTKAAHVRIVGGTNLFVERHLADANIKRRIGLSLPGYMTAAAAVSKTNLVLTLPQMLAERAAQMFPLTVSRLPIALPKVTLVLIWHERGDADPIQKWVREEIASKARAIARVSSKSVQVK